MNHQIPQVQAMVMQSATTRVPVVQVQPVQEPVVQPVQQPVVQPVQQPAIQFFQITMAQTKQAMSNTNRSSKTTDKKIPRGITVQVKMIEGMNTNLIYVNDDEVVEKQDLK